MSDQPGSGVSSRWIEWRRTVDLATYDQRWEEMAARGDAVHGEADFVERLIGDRKIHLLDAGCGTGRLAIEMTKRGHTAQGVDLDPDMIERARFKAPHIVWQVADVSRLDLEARFDVVVMAGNIPLFCAPGSQGAIISSLANHVVSGGYLIAGFSLESRPDAYLRHHYQHDAEAAGLTEIKVFNTWDVPKASENNDSLSTHDNNYVVIVYQRS